jgi:hypothetical protein
MNEDESEARSDHTSSEGTQSHVEAGFEDVLIV